MRSRIPWGSRCHFKTRFALAKPEDPSFGGDADDRM
jgi:hypothetical protein